MDTKTAVVLGGGIGGIVAARRLRQHLRAEDRVVIVERDPLFRFAPSFLWVMAGTRRPDQISRDMRALRRHGIEVVEGSVEGIDVDQHKVMTTSGEVPYDRLVIALGAALDPTAMEGFSEFAHDVYSLDGAQRAGIELGRLQEGPVAVVVSSLPYKCPAAPWEAALVADAQLRRRGVRDRCPVHLYTPEPAPMPVAGPEVGNAVTELLEAREIEIHTETNIGAIRSGTVDLDNGEHSEAHLVLGVPPHRPPSVLAESGLVAGGGFLPVEPTTLSTDIDDVFAIGDVAAVPIAGGRMLPKAGVFAEGEADVVARRIAAELRGDTPTKEFDGHGSCFIELGDGSAGFAGGSFYDEPNPNVRLRRPGRHWHLTKVAYEQWWLRRWL